MLSRRSFLAASLSASTLFGSHASASSDAGSTLQSSSTPHCGSRNDDLWLLSSRNLGCHAGAENTHLWQIRHRATQTSWSDATFTDWQLALAEPLPTLVYVHGNRNDWNWALKNGQSVYNAMVKCGAPERIRFIIYSWPSDQISRPVRDARYKAAVANHETFQFGWLMSHVPAATMLGCIGFSLGARIVSGGLHLLGGGTLHGKSLTANERAAMRAALWAGALNDNWLLPGQAYGQAISTTDKLLNLYNPADPVLQRYDLLARQAQALGYRGATTSCWGEYAARYEQCNVGHMVGRSHEMVKYLAFESIMQQTRQLLFWQT